MATGDGLQATELTVKIGAAGTAYSACTAFTTSLDNFSQSGGGRDVESVPLFGGAFLEREKAREQIEVTLDAKWKHGTALILDQLMMGSVLDGTTLPTSASEPTSKIVWLYWTDSTNHYYRVYNNVTAVNLGDVEQDAEGFLQGTLTFKCAPATSAGTANFKVGIVAPTTF